MKIESEGRRISDVQEYEHKDSLAEQHVHYSPAIRQNYVASASNGKSLDFGVCRTLINSDTFGIPLR